MKEGESRFRAPSDCIDLSRLARENYRIFLVGLFVAVALLVSGVVYFVTTPAKRTVPPPVVTRLIVRKPVPIRPFELRKKRLVPRALTKKVTTLKPQLATISARKVPLLSAFGRVPVFGYSVGTDVQIDLKTTPIKISATAVVSTKEPERRIALREELLDLEALDTGKYKGLVIQDPTDKRKVKGFVYIAMAWGNDLRPTFADAVRAISNLAMAINTHTGITAHVDRHLFLDSQELFRTPFVYITADRAFELTERESKNLGEYMRRGGFVFADNAVPTLEYGPAEASLRQMFRDALGPQARFRPIPNTHPIYHCFYDFDGPPAGQEIGTTATVAYLKPVFTPTPVHFLEGIFLGDRLVGIYSDKGYCHMWAKNFGNEPQLRFGINVVIFALTQKGSIAQQQIDFFSQIGQ